MRKNHRWETPVILTACLVTLLFYNVTGSRPPASAPGFQVVTSTTPAMIEEMAYAIKHRRFVAITGWSPHWMNAKLPLKYLKDPLEIFGKSEGVYSVVRKDFQQDFPAVTALLRQFAWKAVDLDRLSLICHERNGDYETGARQWLKDNHNLVATWLQGVPPQPQAKLKLINSGNHNEVATNMLLKILLEERLGCQVSCVSTTVPIAFAALAEGSQDMMVTVWLPNCHKNEFARIRNDVDIIACNLPDAMSGIAVPDYAPLETIADLRKYQQEFDGKIISIEPGQGIIDLAEQAIRAYGLQAASPRP